MLEQLLEKLNQEFPPIEIQVLDNSTPNGFQLPCEDIHAICSFLHSNESYYFDHLACLSAMDNGVEANTMEVIYTLYSIPKDLHLTIKVQLNRTSPRVKSVSDIWAGANWHEREAYDLFGIDFIDHPDLRRILMPADWVGNPMRKDYVEDEKYHGMTVRHPDKPKHKMGTSYKFEESHLSASEPLKFKTSDLKSEEMIFNVGPQHPATHGVLRLEVITDGEIVKEAIPHIGYLHRCFEKHAENLPYNQTIPFTDRMDYVAAMNNEWAYVMGVERMLGIEKDIPKRVEYIRVLVAELNRLASHFVAIGTYGMDIGAFTPFLWMMRDREHILRMLEWVSGARMLYNYIWVGGLYYDLPVGFEEQANKFCDYVLPKFDDLEKLFITNKIFIDRTANVGVLDRDLAINYGITGPMLRASGLRFDLRKVDAYSVYPELEFNVPIGTGEIGTTGDCWDRTWVRLEECRQSVRIIRQCLTKLTTEFKRDKEFDPRDKVPKKIRPKAQDFYVRAENPKGELGFFFRSEGKTDIPIRCKARGPSFSNLSVLPELSRGVMLADLFAIVGSLDLVMGEVDR